MHLGWSSSRYAGGIAGISHFDIHFLQVLTGGIPFADMRTLLCTPWGTPGQTRECLGNRVFRLTVGFHRTLLEW